MAEPKIKSILARAGPKYEIDPKKTVLFIHDVTKEVVTPTSPFFQPEAQALIPPLKKLLDACRRKNILTVYTWIATRTDDVRDMARQADICRTLQKRFASGSAMEVQKFVMSLSPSRERS